jgi:hypothetical protein
MVQWRGMLTVFPVLLRIRWRQAGLKRILPVEARIGMRHYSDIALGWVQPSAGKTGNDAEEREGGEQARSPPGAWLDESVTGIQGLDMLEASAGR